MTSISEPLTWKNDSSGHYLRLSNGTTWPHPGAVWDAAHKARYNHKALDEKEAMLLASVASAYAQLVSNCQRERNRIAICLKRAAFGERSLGK